MQLREAGIVDSHSWVVNPKSGEQVGSWELMERMEKTYGQPAVAILWENLLNILSDALPDDCKHMGYKCLDVSQDDEGAIVQFQKGDELISVKVKMWSC
jgi:salicylate hydroxylase